MSDHSPAAGVQPEPETEAERVVRLMGGPSAVAVFFGISQPAVSQWVAAGRLPKARRRHLADVRPELLQASESAHA